jgi:hypothetical protein
MYEGYHRFGDKFEEEWLKWQHGNEKQRNKFDAIFNNWKSTQQFFEKFVIYEKNGLINADWLKNTGLQRAKNFLFHYENPCENPYENPCENPYENPYEKLDKVWWEKKMIKKADDMLYDNPNLPDEKTNRPWVYRAIERTEHKSKK